MCLALALGLLGFDLGSQSWHPLLPSELHLGFHLGSLGFHLSSVLDPILDPFASEFYLGFHLESLCFRLSSIWDSILDPFASV